MLITDLRRCSGQQIVQCVLKKKRRLHKMIEYVSYPSIFNHPLQVLSDPLFFYQVPWCICWAIMTLTQSGGQDEDVPRRIIRQYPLQMTKLYVRPGKRNGKGLFLVHNETPPWISLSTFKRHRLCILFCFGLIVRNKNTAHCRFCPIVRAFSWMLDALFEGKFRSAVLWFKRRYTCGNFKYYLSWCKGKRALKNYNIQYLIIEL